MGTDGKKQPNEWKVYILLAKLHFNSWVKLLVQFVFYYGSVYFGSGANEIK